MRIINMLKVTKLALEPSFTQFWRHQTDQSHRFTILTQVSLCCPHEFFRWEFSGKNKSPLLLSLKAPCLANGYDKCRSFLTSLSGMIFWSLFMSMYQTNWAFPMAQQQRIQEMWVQSLDWEDSLEEEMAELEQDSWLPLGILAWKKSHGQRSLDGYSPKVHEVRHFWATEHTHTRPTISFTPLGSRVISQSKEVKQANGTAFGKTIRK